MSRRRTEDELRGILGQAATFGVEPGRRFRHVGGATYVVVAVSLDEEDHRPLVTYRAAGDGPTPAWTRPLQDFLGMVYDQSSGQVVRRFAPREG